MIVANSKGIKNGFPNSLRKKIKVIYPPAIIKTLKLKKVIKNIREILKQFVSVDYQ